MSIGTNSSLFTLLGQSSHLVICSFRSNRYFDYQIGDLWSHISNVKVHRAGFSSYLIFLRNVYPWEDSWPPIVCILTTVYSYNQTWNNMILSSTEYSAQSAETDVWKQCCTDNLHATRLSNSSLDPHPKGLWSTQYVHSWFSAAMPRGLEPSPRSIDFQGTEYFRMMQTIIVGTIADCKVGVLRLEEAFHFFSWRAGQVTERLGVELFGFDGPMLGQRSKSVMEGGWINDTGYDWWDELALRGGPEKLRQGLKQVMPSGQNEQRVLYRDDEETESISRDDSRRRDQVMVDLVLDNHLPACSLCRYFQGEGLSHAWAFGAVFFRLFFLVSALTRFYFSFSLYRQHF